VRPYVQSQRTDAEAKTSHVASDSTKTTETTCRARSGISAPCNETSFALAHRTAVRSQHSSDSESEGGLACGQRRALHRTLRGRLS
jgi:hypothetical protein